MDLDFHTLDVFTTERFGGNPLAVVTNGESLSSAAMQQIAREFNLSETVFVLPPVNPAHSAKIRIFTPQRELPFAGHPTVGSAVLIAELKGRLGPPPSEAIVVLEETVGPVRVGVRHKPGAPVYAELDAPRLPEPLASPPPADRLAVALGLAPSEIGFENHKPTRYSAGLPFTFVPVRNIESIARCALHHGYWTDAFGQGGGAYVYCRETLSTASHFHARMFMPDVGEDPATGSAAAAFAAVPHRFDGLSEGTHTMRIEQGYEMGRPSLITMEAVVRGHALKAVRIGGHAVRVSKGVMTV